MEEDNHELDTTTLYSVEEFEDSLVRTTLNDVCSSLEDRGYNSINQLVGYIMSGDPGYISSHNDARNKIKAVDRSVIVEVLLRNYIDKL